METKDENLTLLKRVKSMLKVDFRRAFSTPLLYIILGICLAVPIAMLVMTSLMGGEGGDMGTFTSVWQAVSTLSGESGGMSMDLTTMCNMNMAYFAAAIFICLFVSAEFKCGYVKNLFAHRAKKGDYVISKTITGTIAGMLMIIAFFIGAIIGGKIGGLSFTMEGFNAGNLICCLLAKLFLVGVFVAIPLVASVVAKQRTWLSVCLSLGLGMLLFMTLSMMTPLNAGIMQVILCLAGGIMFAAALGATSNIILKKTNIL